MAVRNANLGQPDPWWHYEVETRHSGEDDGLHHQFTRCPCGCEDQADDDLPVRNLDGAEAYRLLFVEFRAVPE